MKLGIVSDLHCNIDGLDRAHEGAIQALARIYEGQGDWNRLNDKGYAHDWAREADALVTKLIRERDYAKLIQWTALGKSVELAVNSAEHYVPLLYILGLSHANEKPEFFNAEAVGGALTMTSVRFG